METPDMTYAPDRTNNGARRLVAMLAAVAAILRCGAAPFSPDWNAEWQCVRGEPETVKRQADGTLEFDAVPNRHVYFAGGRDLADVRITARVKFLRADNKYSGFSLFMRWHGDVWEGRDGFWVYLRPKYRALHMQKVMEGRLDAEFAQRVEAKRPAATPIGEWMTLRYEVRGREITVSLNDEKHLSVTDTGPLPLSVGRIAFGVGDAHVLVAEITQEDLNPAAEIRPVSYEYVSKPTRGDEQVAILTDGKVNSREQQAFWRMLGARPEIVFDLGQETFLTSVMLKAISSPAVNIASAEVQGSMDRAQWWTLAVLRNDDGRRACAEHAVSGDIGGIARYVKVILYRPAADQDVELAEVEFSGRQPTERDRVQAAAATYDIGPAMPFPADEGTADDHYWILEGSAIRVAIDREHGLVGGIWNKEHAAKCLERLHDKYYLVTGQGATQASEYEDRVTAVLEERSGQRLRLTCTNAKLADLTIEKTYEVSTDGKRLVKRVAFLPQSTARDRFLTHATGAALVQQFRRGGVYMGGDRGLGARLFAAQVDVPRQLGALGARNSKTVIFQRYDLGWGLAQYRYKVNDRYCRPLTSRWHEKENHPPLYLPTGWEFGLATLHLDPEAPPSTETHLALYEGRQLDFYRMTRGLPEVAEAYTAVSRPAWVRNLKTSSSIALNPLSSDLTGALLPVHRSLQTTETGYLWNLKHIHGIWGEWFSEGTVTSGYGARIDTQWLKDYIREAHSLSPRVKLGVYTWAWAVHPRSQVFKEHPDWFITKDRNGQIFNAYSNMVLNHARRFGIRESMDELIDQFAKIMREYGGDYFYLDGGGGGQNLIDWEHVGCDQDYHYEELYRRIRAVTRARGTDKAVWFNARTGPYWDIGFYEGIDRQLHASTWRESADGLSVVKIRQVLDPGQTVIPLYWRDPTLPFYSNYCIGIGLTPADPLGADKQLTKLPFIEAAYEARNRQWLEADLEPDWRVDSSTEIEAYALRHDDTPVISVIDHRESPDGPAVLTADTTGLGLEPAQSIHAWFVGMRDIRGSWPAQPESVRRQVNSESRWGLDLAGRLLKVETIAEPGARLRLSIPTEPHLLCMVFLSHSAGAVFAVGGLRTHLWSASNLGAAVRTAHDAERSLLTVRAHAPPGGAQFALLAPPGTILRYPAARQRRIAIGQRWLSIIAVEGGAHELEMNVTRAPREAGALDLESPARATAGGTASIGVMPAADTALVNVWRDAVLLFADELPVTDSALRLRIPEQTHAGALLVRIGTFGVKAGATLAWAETTVQITGTVQTELCPIYLPRAAPRQTAGEVNREVNGIRVLQTATLTHDGYDGGLYAYADADTLTVGGGNVDAPRSRYGYGLGGLELDGVRVLSLKVTNTFQHAWTFYRSRVSFKPQYTSTFAGMMVDYHTAAGYTHRVALGLGVLNPKRKAGRPDWGTARAPDEFVSLGDILFESPETLCAIDLARWAPAGWDGRCWLTAGADNVLPARRLQVQILGNAASPEGKEILAGQSMGDLFKLRTYRVVRAATAPTIDGKLDDDLWQRAPPASDFRVLGRTSGSKQPTQAWLAYDAQNLYVAFECQETGKKQLNTAAKKIWNQDAIDLALDVDGDRHDFHQIIVNCRNDSAQFDQNTGGAKRDWGIRTAAAAYDGGWAVEISIPFSDIHATPTAGSKWTGNFVRYRPYPPVHEILTWTPIPGDSLKVPDRFGELLFE